MAAPQLISEPVVTTVRSVNGPEITPTIVAEDGIREVPHLFEYCEVNDLIALIGKFKLYHVSSSLFVRQANSIAQAAIRFVFNRLR